MASLFILMSKGNPVCKHRRVLSPEDIELIKACKLDRDRLRKQLSELTDGKLAEKFECCKSTICRVKTGDEHHYINIGGYRI